MFCCEKCCSKTYYPCTYFKHHIHNWMSNVYLDVEIWDKTRHNMYIYSIFIINTLCLISKFQYRPIVFIIKNSAKKIGTCYSPHTAYITFSPLFSIFGGYMRYFILYLKKTENSHLSDSLTAIFNVGIVMVISKVVT